jgi:hypothetical protein
MLSVIYAKCYLCWVSQISFLCWVLLCWMSYAESRIAKNIIIEFVSRHPRRPRQLQGTTTFCIMKIRITPLSILTFIIMTLIIMTPNILRHYDPQRNNKWNATLSITRLCIKTLYTKFFYVECHYADCHVCCVLQISFLSRVSCMLSVAKKPLKLSVIMLNVLMLGLVVPQIELILSPTLAFSQKIAYVNTP